MAYLNTLCLVFLGLLISPLSLAAPNDGGHEAIGDCVALLSYYDQLQRDQLASKGVAQVPSDAPFLLGLDAVPNLRSPRFFADLMLAADLNDLKAKFNASGSNRTRAEIHFLESLGRDFEFEVADREAFVRGDFHAMGARSVFDRFELFGSIAKIMALGVRSFEKIYFRSAGYQVHWSAGYDAVIYKIEHRVEAVVGVASEEPLNSFIIFQRGRGYSPGGLSPGFPVPIDVKGEHVSYRDMRELNVSFYTELPSAGVVPTAQMIGKRFVYLKELLVFAEDFAMHTEDAQDLVYSSIEQASARGTERVGGFLDQQFSPQAASEVLANVLKRNPFDSDALTIEVMSIEAGMRAFKDAEGRPLLDVSDDLEVSMISYPAVVSGGTGDGAVVVSLAGRRRGPSGGLIADEALIPRVGPPQRP